MSIDRNTAHNKKVSHEAILDYVAEHPRCKSRDILKHLQEVFDNSTDESYIEYHLKLLEDAKCLTYTSERKGYFVTKYWSVGNIDVPLPAGSTRKKGERCPVCGAATLYMSRPHALKCKNKECKFIIPLKPRYLRQQKGVA